MDAHVISLANQKGGTAKTTTCANLGIGLAQAGRKVLLVDADAQGSLTLSLGWEPDELPITLYDLMIKAIQDRPVTHGEGMLHHEEGVDLMPANIELAGMEMSLVSVMYHETILKQVIEPYKHEYDYILIDCAPSLGMMTINALAATDGIVVPTIPQHLPTKGIQFIHDADTEIKKKDLFAKVRSGQVRILFGSTQKLGAGTNVQDRLIALHDLDAPWRPGDLEQRAGRIVRQGNMNPDVHIYRYVTEKSFDSYLWQTIENKQRFISQIMSSKSPVRACDDVDETALSYAEIKALCAGDPRIKEKMDLDIEVAKLRLMKADYQSNQFKLEDQILKQYPEEIRQAQERAKGYRADMALLEAHPLPKDGFVGMAIKGKRIADKEAAGKMLLEACRLSPHDMELGEYRGMKMTVDYDSYRQEVKLVLRGEMSHTVTMGTDVYGNLTRIENALANMPQKLEKAEERIAELERQTEQARAELGKPFAQEKKLEAKAACLAELNAALNIDERRKEPMEKRPMKDVLKAYQERADAQRQGEKGGTNEWNR